MSARQVVARLSVGHRLVSDLGEWTVYGTLKVRGGGYYYLLLDSQGKKSKLLREHMLQAQADGALRVLGP